MAFYNRYVPPAVSKQDSQSITKALKRPATTTFKQGAKKQKVESKNIVHDTGKPLASEIVVDDTNRPNSTPDKAVQVQTPASINESGRDLNVKSKKKPKREKKKNSHVQEESNDEQDQTHKRVLSRYTNSRSIKPPDDDQQKSTAQLETQRSLRPQPVAHDLKPLPQPIPREEPKPLPSYSTLPSWLQQPIRTSGTSSVPFSTFGLQPALLNNLKTQLIPSALPVQATVLPLLLQPLHDRVDLCISAATGSGKTLAYVLPILQSLVGETTTRLRAVIVVPTRTLVRQVLQTLTTCSVGLNINILGAEGTRALSEEQDLLVQEYSLYDPEEYRRQNISSIDWDTFSLESIIAESKKPALNAGCIRFYASKVDILVCTPGRLSEHLQSTVGFNLDHVQWFVIDEADRLLNESYYEWLEDVLPALQSRAVTKDRDEVLRKVRMEVPARRVTKVLLSATMTKDVTQLLALQLLDPKLVVVENEHEQKDEQAVSSSGTQQDGGAQAEYQLPPRLIEHAVAVKESAEKPLYLLKVLQENMLTQDKPHGQPSTKETRNGTDTSIGEDSDSSSASSDTSSDTTSSSGDNSDSDSDSTSDADSDSATSASSISSPSASGSSTASTSKSTLTPPSSRILIFTSSTQSTHRLSRLISLLSPTLASKLATFTRTTSNPSILQSFRTGKTQILITTDLASRGLDIPGLTHVINYDIPSSRAGYVHRVGRTARAGESGEAWTLVEFKQARWFWTEIGKSEEVDRAGEVQRVNVVLDEKSRDGYEEALGQLGEDVRADGR